ncbi:MAG: division/cell wall cluster transcriptional repressor MraZ [Candidatus Paceibacterota bacterium]
MLIGEYTHTLDDKKRISLPAKFRRELGKTVVLTRGLDNCLFLYSLSRWEQISEKLTQLSFGQSDSRNLNRFMLSGAVEANVDSSGRILIPDVLKEFASLEDKVILAGVGNRVEVWNTESWEECKERIESQADMLAERLGDVGMI